MQLLVNVERTVGDSIRIEQLEICARIGVTEEERAQPQRITISVTIWPLAAFDQLEDDLAKTTDYSALCRVVREFVENRAYNLIETLAAALASELLAKFRLRAVDIEVRKFVLPSTEYVAAIVHRTNISG